MASEKKRALEKSIPLAELVRRNAESQKDRAEEKAAKAAKR
ncbi:hypothetical protein [Streptomyces sp. NRRL S-1813]|nr:hypothetical protein [Streptomyces sp. NRRL S-1813]